MKKNAIHHCEIVKLMLYRDPTILFGHFEKSTSRWSQVPKTFEIVSTKLRSENPLLV